MKKRVPQLNPNSVLSGMFHPSIASIFKHTPQFHDKRIAKIHEITRAYINGISSNAKRLTKVVKKGRDIQYKLPYSVRRSMEHRLTEAASLLTELFNVEACRNNNNSMNERQKKRQSASVDDDRNRKQGEMIQNHKGFFRYDSQSLCDPLYMNDVYIIIGCMTLLMPSHRPLWDALDHLIERKGQVLGQIQGDSVEPLLDVLLVGSHALLLANRNFLLNGSHIDAREGRRTHMNRHRRESASDDRGRGHLAVGPIQVFDHLRKADKDGMYLTDSNLHKYFSASRYNYHHNDNNDNDNDGGAHNVHHRDELLQGLNRTSLYTSLIADLGHHTSTRPLALARIFPYLHDNLMVLYSSMNQVNHNNQRSDLNHQDDHNRHNISRNKMGGESGRRGRRGYQYTVDYVQLKHLWESSKLNVLIGSCDTYMPQGGMGDKKALYCVNLDSIVSFYATMNLLLIDSLQARPYQMSYDVQSVLTYLDSMKLIVNKVTRDSHKHTRKGVVGDVQGAMGTPVNEPMYVREAYFKDRMNYSYAVEVMVDILIRNNFFDCEDIYMRHLVELLLEAGETQHVSSIINCFVNRGYHNVDTSIRRGGSDQSGWADKGLAKNGLDVLLPLLDKTEDDMTTRDGILALTMHAYSRMNRHKLRAIDSQQYHEVNRILRYVEGVLISMLEKQLKVLENVDDVMKDGDIEKPITFSLAEVSQLLLYYGQSDRMHPKIVPLCNQLIECLLPKEDMSHITAPDGEDDETDAGTRMGRKDGNKARTTLSLPHLTNPLWVNARLNHHPENLSRMKKRLVEYYDKFNSKAQICNMNSNEKNSSIFALWSLSILNALDIDTFLLFVPLWADLLQNKGLRRQLVFAMKKVIQHVALLQAEHRDAVTDQEDAYQVWRQQNSLLYDLYEQIEDRSDGNRVVSREQEGIQYSNFHKDVSNTLSRMGIQHSNEVLVGNERVDIYIANPDYHDTKENTNTYDSGDIQTLLLRMSPPVSVSPKAKAISSSPDKSVHQQLTPLPFTVDDANKPARGLILEVNGPYHYDSYASRPLGPTIAKERHLKGVNYRVVSINYNDWAPLFYKKDKEKNRFIRNILGIQVIPHIHRNSTYQKEEKKQ